MNRDLFCAVGVAVLCIAHPALAQNQRVDAELKGISLIGVVVEDLSSQAAACGLKRETIENAAEKALAGSGLKVVRNSDNETYLYVNVMTTSIQPGLCVSRYDTYLYTHTTATLSYQTAPVLVQVSLIHEGGMAGGASAGHADTIVRSLSQYIEQIAARIRRANQS